MNRRMIEPEQLAAILDDRAAAGLPRRPVRRRGKPSTIGVDIYAGFGGAGEGVGAGLLGGDRPSAWSWLSFKIGVLVGFVAGLLTLAIPAMLIGIFHG